MFSPQTPPELPPEMMRGNPTPIVAIREIDLSSEDLSPAFRKKTAAGESQLATLIPKLQQAEEPPPSMKLGLPASHYDGAYVGGSGDCFAAHHSYSRVPPFTPMQTEKKELIIYVNGICTPLDTMCSELARVAYAAQRPVLGIYNATETPFLDVMQAIQDSFDFGRNPAVNTLTRALTERLREKKPTHLLAESHGALICARAIVNAKNQLRTEGISEPEIMERLKSVRVETHGGAAAHYPDGPRYVHYINELDAIPYHFGLTRYGMSAESFDALEKKLITPEWFSAITTTMKVLNIADFELHPGKDARIVRFQESNPREHWLNNHLIGAYLPHRVDFDQAHAAPPAEKNETSGESARAMLKRVAYVAGAFLAGYLLGLFRRRKRE